MKIPKVIVSSDASILEQQALTLSEAALSSEEARFIGAENNPLRRAQRALSSDYILPLAKPTNIRPGDMAEAAPINTFTRDVHLDLLTVERTGRAMAELMRVGHNVVSTEENALVSELKLLRERLVALKLYSFDTLGETESIRYSFGVGERVLPIADAPAPTLNEEEGILTLPVISQEKLEISELTIEVGSNGGLGNGSERERPTYSDLRAAIDGTDTTWFEYERVGAQRSNLPLRLVLRGVLKSPGVINKIVINPANLGGPNWLKIEDIQLSSGGRFVSIKEELKGADWSDEESFNLSPANSSYANRGIFSFSPRPVDEFVIKLRQDEPYLINNGAQWRYLIGLREVEVFKVKYGPEARFQFQPTVLQRPVLGLGVLENVYHPIPDAFESIYSVSIDGGSNWVDLATLENLDSSVQEALFLDVPLSTILIRGSIKRSQESFAELVPTDQSILDIEEKLVDIGGNVTSNIQLLNKPETFVEVIRTGYGYRGGDQGVYIGTISRAAGVEESFPLPFKPEGSFSLVADGKRILKVSGFDDEEDEGFVFSRNLNPPLVTLGGAKPPPGTDIYMRMAPLANPEFIESNIGFQINLREQSDKIKTLSSVHVVDPIWRVSTKRVGPTIKTVQLPDTVPNGLFLPTGIFNDSYTYDMGNDFVTFVDGESEFRNAEGEAYSIDIWNRAIYLKSGSSNGDTTVTYRSPKWVKVPEKDWNYHNQHNAIVGNSPLLNAKNGSVRIPAQMNQRSLRITPEGWEAATEYSIAKGSLIGLNENNVSGIARTLSTEVPFIDGTSEFDPYVSILGGLGYFSVDYSTSTVYLPRQDGIAVADRGFLPGLIQFRYIALSISYGIGEKLQDVVDYKRKGSVLELTPAFTRRLTSSSRGLRSGGVAHVRYDAKLSQGVEGSAIVDYFSPIIRDVVVIGVATDPRLSTLERL